MKRTFFVLCIVCALGAWVGPARAVVVPQPMGMFIAKEAESFLVQDDVVGTADALRAHEEKTGELLAYQASVGAYDPSLSELWLTLAYEALQLKRQASAAHFFQQGLHNLRLNSGLTTETQVAALTEWIGALRRLDDSTGLSEQLEYRYRVTGYGEGAWDSDTFGYAVEYYDHELGRLATTDWASIEPEIIRFERHLDKVIEHTCSADTGDRQWCGALVKRQLQLLYLVAYNVEPVVDDRLAQPLGAASQLGRQSVNDERLLTLERTAYGQGVALLRQAIEFTDEDDDLALVLADWRWFFGRRILALDAYRTLHESNPRPFLEPVALPEGLINPGSYSVSDDRSAAQLSFTVSKRGRVRDVKLTTELERDKGTNRIQRALRAVRFRPALDADGEPRVNVVTARYRYLR